MISKRSLYHRHIAKTDPDGAQIQIEGAQGVFLFDEKGRRYFDLASGIGPSILGHQHPVVNEALHTQGMAYLHTMVYGMHIQSPQVEYGCSLIDQLPMSFDQVYFLTTGSEAVEVGLKIAKIFTGRSEVIAAARAYHGSTMAAESLRSDMDFLRKLAPVLPGVHHLRFNHMSDVDRINAHTACVIMETVQAEAGILEPDIDFLKAVRQRCDEQGALLIFDEIQVGLGRVGCLFAFQKYGVQPDILLLGKALGGGMPLSAVVTRKEVMQGISHEVPLAHLTTFGGHPLCCAVGHAVFQHIVDHQLWQRSEQIGQMYERYLGALSPRFKRAGSMFGMAMSSAEEAHRLHQRLEAAGIISDLLLFEPNMVRMAPPLTISDEEIRESAEWIRDVIALF